ncbi:ABC transporter permease [Thermomonas sp.]|uniref:ABC transporter permease n=1 Tax=Thermomonas sp. TaxID=1971895 RepID=UPI00257DA710|nr:ABC transporter permease [Thermomonas sp.]
MGAMLPAVERPALRSYLLEAKCEFLRMLRDPAFCIPVTCFPLMFYLLFAVVLNKQHSAATAQYLLATYGAFGVAGAGLFGFGVTIALDRERGFLRLKQVLPTPPGALLLARMAMAMLFAAAISLLMALLAATVAGVVLSPLQWLALLVVNMGGVLPFAAVGLYVGTRVSGSAAPALLNGLYLPMSFLSGLWLPLSMLPPLLAKLAVVWPAYHLGQLALKVVGHDQGQPAWLHLLALAGFTAVFFALAQRRLGAAE